MTKLEKLFKNIKERQPKKDESEIIELLGSNLKAFYNRNKNIYHINYKIYHLLCHPFTFINAYGRIVKNQGATTRGIEKDFGLLEYFDISKAEQIAKKFKTDQYYWQPARRTWIPKPGKTTKRPIDTPTQEDRIVQEAIRGILESIFEPEFQEFEQKTNYMATNYGFRPNKSTWQAVEKLKLFGQATTYAIEGDIIGAYNNVDHSILLQILGKRIKDKRFLKTMKNLLKSGIMEKNSYQHSLKGTPQGGIVSPLLFNIYMFEFDKFIYYNIILIQQEQNKTKISKRNPMYNKLGYKIKKLKNQYKNINNYKEIKNQRKEIKKLIFKRNQIPSYQISSLPKKSIYCRYADDWVLLYTGNYNEMVLLKENINSFIKENLKMELDPDKTLISHIQSGFKFLGFSIKMYTKDQTRLKRMIIKKENRFSRITRRTTSRKITIIPDKDRLLRNLEIRKFCNKQKFPIGIRSWSIFDEFEIVLKYRQIMLGIYIYYQKCDYTHILNQVSYILQYSCAKTLATRQKTSIRQIFKKYGTDLKIHRTFQSTNKTINKTIKFDTFTILRKTIFQNKRTKTMEDPFHIKSFWRTKIKLFNSCCRCGSNEYVGLHHINSLRSIKQRQREKFQYKIQSKIRLQIPLCRDCHNLITYGKYNDTMSPVEYYENFITNI